MSLIRIKRLLRFIFLQKYMDVELFTKEFNEWVERVFKFQNDCFRINANIVSGKLGRKRILVGYGDGGYHIFDGHYLRSRKVRELYKRMKEDALREWGNYGFREEINISTLTQEDRELFESYVSGYKMKLLHSNTMMDVYRNEKESLEKTIAILTQRLNGDKLISLF